MAQGQRFADEDVTVAVVGVVVEVGAAEAGAVDADLEFVWEGRGKGTGFLRFDMLVRLLDRFRRQYRTIRRSFEPCRTLACAVVVVDEAIMGG